MSIKNKLDQLFDQYKGSNRYTKIASDEEIRGYFLENYPHYDVDKDTSMLVSLFNLGLKEIPTCANPTCNNKVSYQNKKFRITCSQSCRRVMDNKDGTMQEVLKKARKTYKEKTGLDHQMQSDEVKNKIKETNLERYGKEYATQNNDIKNKIKETNLERYGTSCSLDNEEIRKKTIETLIKKYGVDHPFRSENIKEKYKETMMERYGVEHSFQNPEFVQKSKDTSSKKYGSSTYISSDTYLSQKKENFYKSLDENRIGNVEPMFTVDEYVSNGVNGLYAWKCIECFTEFDDTIANNTKPKCPVCHPRETDGEIKIKTLLNDLGIKYEYCNRTLVSPFELDFYLPDHNIAIEYCGLYWHSVKIRPDTNYHLNKLNSCLSKNIKLITVFSDDNWDNVVDRLTYLLGKNSEKTYARKCIVKTITTQEAKRFCNKNHLQGYGNASIKYGLFLENKLVSVMTFSNKNISRKGSDWEIIRFCSSGNVVGAAGKLFKHFLKNVDPEKVISYADRRWSEGHVYENLGMNLDSSTKPNYWYFKGNKRYHRYTLRKGAVKEDDLSLTEFENRDIQGWNRIYDCGSNKYVYNKKDKK